MARHLLNLTLPLVGALLGAMGGLWFGLREGQRLAWQISQKIA